MKYTCSVKVLILFIFLFGSTAIDAHVSLPIVFSDNMVLQQGVPVSIWGNAMPNEKVTVKFQAQTKQTAADANGKWAVALDPLTATKIPQQLTVKGKKNAVVRKNILIGEVWLASGQSNMEYAMNSYTYFAKPQKGDPDHQEKALKSAGNPIIRTLFVKQNLNTDTLPSDGWQMLGKKTLAPVSAPGYFFAKILADSLDVPVGLISTSWGGTVIESWMTTGERYKKMVKPLVPYALRGFLWYQGESNLVNGDTPADYVFKQKTLIETWRAEWGNAQLPFYFVQLAPHTYSQKRGRSHVNTWEALPFFWAAQTCFIEHPEKTVQNTGMVVTTDLVDNPNDIHPPYKWVVGERLARWVLANDYGKTGLVFCGPMYKSHRVEGNKMIVEFLHTGSGLVTSDEKEPDWFEISNKNGQFFKAKAVIVGNDKIELTSNEVKEPVSLRFAWDEIAMPNLFNREGLPAIPFSKDARVENALKTSISSPKYISKQDISYVSATEKDAYRLERCKLDIYYPAGKQGFATIVWFHGGGLEEGWRFIPEELKNAEIAVVPVNYRLYPQAKNPAYTVDVAESIAWVFANIEKFGGDKMKIYIAGHSAGAYLALMVGLDKSYLAKHNVDADKIRGLIPISGQTNTHWAVKKEYGMDVYMPFIDRFAPIFHARKNAPSTLLITGDRKLEMIARYEENAHLEAMLKYYGSEVTLYELQGFDHNTMLAPACRLLLKWIK